MIGIGVDTTGSTPLPVDAQARPLAMDPRWKDNLAAHAWLWKDHTSAGEAVAITETAKAHAPELLAPIGGTYSSEWWWSKIWRCLKVAPDVFDAAASWVELADFVPGGPRGRQRLDADRPLRVCGGTQGDVLRRLGRPAAQELPRPARPEARRPAGPLVRQGVARRPPGGTPERRLGEGIRSAPRHRDRDGRLRRALRRRRLRHTTGTLVKIIGTSTCDCAIAPAAGKIADVPGICGIVNGSILPDYYGIEAGQSAVGDILNWWVRFCQGDESLHELLSAHAARLKPGESGIVALDWNNGNRTVLVDPRLTGLLIGQTLHTTPPEIYRALIEATAFGARVIIERLREYGVPIERVVCCGGIAEKNDLFMQIYADVIGQPMLIAGSPQTPALGAALSAAVTAGAADGGYATWDEAQKRMTTLKEKRFEPRPGARRVYDALYGIYRELHDAFGGVPDARPDLGVTDEAAAGHQGRVRA